MALKLNSRQTERELQKSDYVGQSCVYKKNYSFLFPKYFKHLNRSRAARKLTQNNVHERVIYNVQLESMSGTTTERVRRSKTKITC